MTLVKVLITQYNAQGAKVGVSGQLTFVPTRAQILPGDPDNLVLPEPFSVKLVNGAANVNLDPSTNEWAYKVSTTILGGNKVPDKYVSVPNVPSIDYTDLQEVDPATLTQLEIVPEPIWYTYVDGLELTAREAADTATEMAESLIPIKESVDASLAAALIAEANAEGSASAASASEQAASLSRLDAQAAAVAALASEQASLVSEDAAETSAASASASAATASTKASEALTSASNAASSASSASTSAATATTQAETATQKASEATASATGASQSATTATQKASDAQDSAEAALSSQNAASSSASGAASSATASGLSATASETSRVAAEAARTGSETARTAAEIAQAAAEAKADEAAINATSFSIGTVVTTTTDPAAASITGEATERKLNLDIPLNMLTIGEVETLPANPLTTFSITGTTTGPSDATPHELRGTGQPNGIRTAPPGTYYTDSLGTNGAWRWIKKTGTGNTGWTVISGDTGWRDVSSGLGTGYLLKLRRIDSIVHISFNVGNNTSAMPDYSIPIGFRLINVDLQRAMYRGGTPNITGYYRISGGAVVIYTGNLNTINATGYEVGATLEDWPTTLPGTAV